MTEESSELERFKRGEEEIRRRLSLFGTRSKSYYTDLAKLSESLDNASENQTWNERDIAYSEALLAQYISLRQESMATINNRLYIVISGIFLIVLMFGFSFTIQDPQNSRLTVYSIFSFIIPAISNLVIFLWLGEAMRAHRVGYFLASDVEAKINQKFSRFIINWESALWAGQLPRDEVFGPSMVTLGILESISLLSPIYGLLVAGINGVGLEAFLIVCFPYFLFIFTVIFIFLNRYRLTNNKRIGSVFI